MYTKQKRQSPSLDRAMSIRSLSIILVAISIVSLCLYVSHLYASNLDALALPQIEYHHTCTLVIPKSEETNITWMHTRLPDLLAPSGPLTLNLYSADNLTAGHHMPANKGHEAMAYLSYLVDSYDSFPDVSIFIHGRETDWHNPRLVSGTSGDSAPMLRRLDLDKVARDGYVNLLCEWQTGCPAHIRPHAADPGQDVPEAALFARVWPELFDGEPAPDVLAQACCSQFAVSSERLRAVPRETYARLRAWLVGTPLDDHDSGRIFEYVWQYLFAGEAVFCPDPMLCYCEAYGVCFEGPQGYEDYFALRRRLDCQEQDLRKLDEWDVGRMGEVSEEELEEMMELIDEKSERLGARVEVASMMALDMKERIASLRERIAERSEGIKAQLVAVERGALEYGSDPQLRASAIEARRAAPGRLVDGVQCNRDLDDWG